MPDSSLYFILSTCSYLSDLPQLIRNTKFPWLSNVSGKSIDARSVTSENVEEGTLGSIPAVCKPAFLAQLGRGCQPGLSLKTAGYRAYSNLRSGVRFYFWIFSNSDPLPRKIKADDWSQVKAALTWTERDLPRGTTRNFWWRCGARFF